ncbi:hypothetical protein BD410DRAFT_824070 [Rickenella mellea]|uniref:Uncharacterized protein n=1 Tax=Rickenella mellea TaxID=50990 RepID=A0A4V3AZR7_9AGAM|nr:hypothetical protein BD410DRAFT_824070 [Rickenella mellea]
MTITRKQMDKETIQNIRGILSRVESNGGTVEKSLSFDAQASRRMSSRGGTNALHNLSKGKLRQLKKSRDCLRLILEATNSDIYSLERDTWSSSLQFGIQSLPDDVLRGIFEAGIRRSGPTRNEDEELYPVHLSHVNRRFRSIALAAPRIWARLSNSLTMTQLEVYIERSKATGLNVFLDIVYLMDEDKGCTVEEFLTLTIQQSKRWQTFEFVCGRMEHEEGYQWGYTHPMIFGYGLHLPCLTSLTWRKECYDEEHEDSDLPIFFEDGELPELMHFDGLNVVVNAPSVGSNLISATFRFEPESDSEWDLNDTFRAFAGSTNLKNLSIGFADMKTHKFTFQPAKLENLSSFELTLGGFINDGFILNILSDLSMPRLDSIGFTFGRGFEHGVRDITAVFQGMMAMINRCGTLQKLAMDFTGYPNPHGWTMISALAQKLQPLNEVTLKALKDYESFMLPGLLKSPVPWRLLRLRECDKKVYGLICAMVAKYSDNIW